ncbi:MAG: hypothetical protein GY771_02850, partial [bacterium]|nr:hypothetical protein [bacterium]
MKSLALPNRKLTVLTVIVGLIPFTCPVLAENNGTNGRVEPDADEVNLFENVVETVYDIEVGNDPVMGDKDDKETRKAFFELLDEGVGFARDGNAEEAIDVFTTAMGEGYPSAAPYYNIAVMSEYDKDGDRYKGENLNYGIVLYNIAL